MNIDRIKAEIEGVKRELMSLGEMRPGSLSEQYNVCGNPKCRCKNKENPRKHGPYYNLSYTRSGKGKTEFVRKAQVETVKQQVANYKRFVELTNRWVDLSLELALEHRESIS
jgi:hypothetical protein